MSLFHRHRWRFIRSDPYQSHFIWTPPEQSGLVTIALYQCDRCKQIRTKRLPGIWTNDDLKESQP